MLSYLSDGIMHGVETRTSAPVQITRRPDTLESVSLSGLYPAGEGAGYAGGIVVSICVCIYMCCTVVV